MPFSFLHPRTPSRPTPAVRGQPPARRGWPRRTRRALQRGEVADPVGEPEPAGRLAVRHRPLRGRGSSGPVTLHPGICPRQRAASRAAPARSPRAGPLRLPRPWRRCRGGPSFLPLRKGGPGSAPPSPKEGTGRRTATIPGPPRRNRFPRADPPLAAPRDDWVPLPCGRFPAGRRPAPHLGCSQLTRWRRGGLSPKSGMSRPKRAGLHSIRQDVCLPSAHQAARQGYRG